MVALVFLVFIGIALYISPVLRCALAHPFKVVANAAPDIRRHYKNKEYNRRQTGNLDVYCGYFGYGKTLSLVKQVVDREYNRYNGLEVWDKSKNKFVTQRIVILSNVTLKVPYIPLSSLAQIVKCSQELKKYDLEHDTYTVIVVCLDELSVQLNSRSFKDNVNPFFLNCLLCCRHYHISFYGSAQRFFHVDKMLRDVTMNVIQCKKVWRFQCNFYYDAWEMENAMSPAMLKPLKKVCWFVENKDYDAYNTEDVVSNLEKKFEEKDFLTDEEILALIGEPTANTEILERPSKLYRKRFKRKQ